MSDDLPDDVVIAEASTEDVGAIADRWVELATGQRRYGSHLVADGNRSQIYEVIHHLVATGTVLVARRSDDVIGFVTFDVETGRYREDTTRGMIHNIYVQESDRGDGIGSELLIAAEETLRTMGVEAVALQVMAENDQARSFYAGHGYAPHRIELEKPINGDPLTTDDDT